MKYIIFVMTDLSFHIHDDLFYICIIQRIKYICIDQYVSSNTLRNSMSAAEASALELLEEDDDFEVINDYFRLSTEF